MANEMSVICPECGQLWDVCTCSGWAAQPHRTYQLQWRRCGKRGCATCRLAWGHGPYWYAYWHEGGRLRSAYVGKQRPAGMAADVAALHEQRALAVAQQRVREKGAMMMADDTLVLLSAAEVEQMRSALGAASEHNLETLSVAVEFHVRLLATLDAAIAERDACREIVAAVATIELVYQDEHVEYVCPGCKEFVSAAWERHAPPQYLTHQAWAEDRIKHAADCPIARARTLSPKGGEE